MNEANEIETITGGGDWVDPQYDRAGNMIAGPEAGDETVRLHFVYDAWNRLRKVYEDDGDGEFEPSDAQGGGDDALLATYEFDGTGRRIEKHTTADAPGGAKDVDYYFNADWQLLESETVAGGSTSVDQYVWSVTYVDAPVGRWHDHNGDGDYLDYSDDGQENDDTIRYFTRDGNFNVTAAVEGTYSEGWTWQLAERYVYTPYGEATVYDDQWDNPAAPTADGPFYCGYFFDAETALYHVRWRIYHPTLAVFLTRDPIGYAATVNLYLYASNAPVSCTDPLGLAPNQQGATNAEYLLKLIRRLEGEGKSAEEILDYVRDNHTTNQNRYFYTEEYGWVDIRHFAAAAQLAWGLGPAGNEAANLGGLIIEIRQWWNEGENDYHSGFSEEDMRSNNAGGDFGEDYVGHYDCLSEAFKQWMEDNGAAWSQQEFQKLPLTDPADPKVGGVGQRGVSPGSVGSNDLLGSQGSTTNSVSNSVDNPKPRRWDWGGYYFGI